MIILRLIRTVDIHGRIFCEWVHVGIVVCVSHCKYNVKLHSSVVFDCLVAALVSESKVKFRQASNHCKSILGYTNKLKSLPFPKNLVFSTFDKFLIKSSTKVNLLYLLHSVASRCCLLHLIKQNWSLKTFLGALTLITQVSL